MEVLHRISSLAGRSNDPQAAIAEILSAAMQTLGADAGHVALHNPNSGLLEVEVEHGLPAESHDVAFRPGQGITGWVGLHGRPRVVEDVADEPRYISIRPATRALVAAPISAEGGQVLGVLCLHSNRAGRFGPEDGERLSRLTAEASAVMRRLWELGHLRAKAKQLEALISIAQSLVTKLTPEELYEGITRNALLVTKARACALYLHDADARTLRCATLSAETEIAAPEGDMPLGSCLNAAVVATRRQAEFQNIHSPDYEDLVDLPRDDKIQSVLATPVLSGGEVLGVLTVFTEVVHRFDNDEKRLCDALGRLAAVTLENARLYSRVFQSEALLRKNEQLTTLGLLAAEIAHEIRNPLTVIKLLYGYLGLDFPEGDPRRTDVRLIAEKLDQLEGIVSRVLTFAKAPGGLHSRWPVADLVEETLLLIRLKLAQHKIQLVYEAPQESFVVDVNKGQIQQVLLNLLLNSTQAMPDGGVIKVTLTEGASQNGPVVNIDIGDTGTGMPPEISGRIFDSFLSGRPDGTGLGLAIAKRILVSHHGDIGLLNTGPSGTTMRVSLPLARG